MTQVTKRQFDSEPKLTFWFALIHGLFNGTLPTVQVPQWNNKLDRMWLCDISRYQLSPFLQAMTKCMTKDRLFNSKWRNLELKSEILLSDYDYCSSASWGEERVITVSWNCDPQVEVSILLTWKTYVTCHTEQWIPVFV